jgi:hypothetical protein
VHRRTPSESKPSGAGSDKRPGGRSSNALDFRFGMRIRVEPENGTDLDRLITALLNATGVVHRAIHAVDHRKVSDPTELMDVVAERLRGSLTLLAELRADEDLALTTQVLAETTLLAAEDLRMEGAFYEG